MKTTRRGLFGILAAGIAGMGAATALKPGDVFSLRSVNLVNPGRWFYEKGQTRKPGEDGADYWYQVPFEPGEEEEARLRLTEKIHDEARGRRVQFFAMYLPDCVEGAFNGAWGELPMVRRIKYWDPCAEDGATIVHRADVLVRFV